MVKNEKITNSLTKTKTKTKKWWKLKRNWNEKIVNENENENAKQQNLSLNESPSIQYGAYGCYGRTALNRWLTMDGI